MENTATTVKDPTIALTILSQLGGKQFIAMTGAKYLVDTGNGLRFAIGRNMTSINRVEITYNYGQDLYDMRFYRQTTSRKTYEIKEKTMKEYKGVFCDQLQSLFTQTTGMYTRLF